jgi:hypothetical protein
VVVVLAVARAHQVDFLVARAVPVVLVAEQMISASVLVDRVQPQVDDQVVLLQAHDQDKAPHRVLLAGLHQVVKLASAAAAKPHLLNDECSSCSFWRNKHLGAW